MKDKIKIILIVLITAIVSIGTTVAASIAISASNITIDSDKTDKTSVADALDELYDVTEGPIYCKKNNAGNYVCPIKMPKCVRAKQLHTETCNQTDTSYYCSAMGSIGNGNTITYGNTNPTKEVLNTGDAFTCDVNGDGIYNEETERFYYVSDLYTGGEEGSETFDENTAVLIYYSNVVISGTPLTVIQNNTTAIVYNSTDKNYQGPLTAITHIPGRDQWTNISINETRQIRSEKGKTTTSGGTIVNYTYTNKAARLLTTQELNRGCELTISTMGTLGALDTTICRFLLENTKYANSTNIGYWLETPNTSRGDGVWVVNSNHRRVGDNYAKNGNSDGVRPAIEVAKTDISY